MDNTTVKEKSELRNRYNQIHINFFNIYYENMSIQIYWKFYHQKHKNFQIKNSDIFQNFCSKHTVLAIYVLSRNKKNKVYPCKPQFYYIQVDFKGVKIIQAWFRDEREKDRKYN